MSGDCDGDGDNGGGGESGGIGGASLGGVVAEGGGGAVARGGGGESGGTGGALVRACGVVAGGVLLCSCRSAVCFFCFSSSELLVEDGDVLLLFLSR